MTHRNLVKQAQVSEAVNEEEQIDCTRDYREPGTPGLPGYESLPKVECATNPKKLAGDEHHNYGEEEQVKEASVFIWVYKPKGSISKDQQKNDRAPMSDHALINCGETDHPGSTGAG